MDQTKANLRDAGDASLAFLFAFGVLFAVRLTWIVNAIGHARYLQ